MPRGLLVNQARSSLPGKNDVGIFDHEVLLEISSTIGNNLKNIYLGWNVEEHLLLPKSVLYRAASILVDCRNQNGYWI